MLLYSTLALLLLGPLSALAARVPRDAAPTDVVPGQTYNGPSTVQFTSSSSGFDGPKITNLNATTFDLWYFDVISYDASSSIVIVFFTAEPQALFPGAVDLGTADYVEIFVTTDDGVNFVTAFGADSLTVVTSGDGSSGSLDGGAAGWTGTSDMSRYTVNINAPDQGITGTLTLQSVAPAHFPCAAASDSAGQSFVLAPGLGWANAVPDADSTVNLVVDGQTVSFSGTGYHDKNWGSQPWDTTLDTWYWGHARVGPYSIVWFDYVDPHGQEGVSAYVAQNGAILAATCSGLRVRPSGGDSTYPPTVNTGNPDGFTISIDIPGQGTFALNALDGEMTLDVQGTSVRWIGTITGTLGGQQFSGAGIYEQFTFAQ